MRKLILTIAICCTGSFLFAQETSLISADRPGQSVSADVVNTGDVQFESGFSYEHINSAVLKTSYNSTLVRYGLVQNVELRLGMEFLGFHQAMDGGDYDKSGFGPLVIGTKVFLKEEQDQIPQLALLANFSIPKSGTKAFENQHLGAEFRLNGNYSINQAMSFGVNIGVAWTGAEGEDYAVGLYTAVIGLDLSEKVGAFAELYGFLPGEGKNDHRWDGGISYLVKDNLQLDFSTGIGLSKVSPDFFISLGLSIRMP